MNLKKWKRAGMLGLISFSLLLWGCNPSKEKSSQENLQQGAPDSAESALTEENALDQSTDFETISENALNHTSENAADLPALADVAVQKEDEGGISFDSTIEEFQKLGFEFGDSVKITFSNGYELKNAPFYNGTYTKTKAPFLSGKPNESRITLRTAFDEDLWTLYGMGENDTATITLEEAGKYAGVILCANLTYSNQREDFDSDGAFANFRSVSMGTMKKDMVYRAASPCDNMFQRASYVDGLMSQAGIAFVLDLSDDDERIREHLAKPDFKSEYFKSLYDAGRVEAVRLTVDYESEEFAGKLVKGLIRLSESEGPFLIHCTEGKERTGFVCALLGSLSGAGYDEIKNDFMISYENYYGITEVSDKEKYDAIVRSYLDSMLQIIAGEGADVKSADLEAGARAYLAVGGMTPDRIEKLKSRISGQ